MSLDKKYIKSYALQLGCYALSFITLLVVLFGSAPEVLINTWYVVFAFISTVMVVFGSITLFGMHRIDDEDMPKKLRKQILDTAAKILSEESSILKGKTKVFVNTLSSLAILTVSAMMGYMFVFFIYAAAWFINKVIVRKSKEILGGVDE